MKLTKKIVGALAAIALLFAGASTNSLQEVIQNSQVKQLK